MSQPKRGVSRQLTAQSWQGARIVFTSATTLLYKSRKQRYTPILQGYSIPFPLLPRTPLFPVADDACMLPQPDLITFRPRAPHLERGPLLKKVAYPAQSTCSSLPCDVMRVGPRFLPLSPFLVTACALRTTVCPLNNNKPRHRFVGVSESR